MCLLKLEVMNDPDKQPRPHTQLFQTIDIIIPYVETIFEISTMWVTCTNIRLREAGIVNDKIGVVNYESTGLEFPYFSYRTIQGKIHHLVFKDRDVAIKARDLILQSVDDFYKNYSQYVTSLNK